jgi:hypothetical protein
MRHQLQEEQQGQEEQFTPGTTGHFNGTSAPSQRAEMSADSRVLQKVDLGRIVRVRSNVPERDQSGHVVALWERHESHPGGEVFIAGARVVEVALTPAVVVRLERGTLEIVED